MAEVSYLSCTNKGCYATGYHKLDLDSQKVICEDCGQDVDVTPYMKKILKSNGQVFRKAKTAKESVCPSCKKADVPALLDYGKEVYEVVCTHCGVVNEHLTNYFVEPMKLNPGIEKIKVKIEELGDGVGIVVQADGKKLPWSAVGKVESDESVFAEIETETKQIAEDEALPVTRPPAKVRNAPVSAQEMLSRAKMKYTGDEEGSDGEVPARKIMKQSKTTVPNNRPKTASEMLQRAGFEVALFDEDGGE